MRATLVRVLLCALVAGLCWGGAIWYWRATGRMPDTTRVILVLVLLPAAILVLWFLGRRLLALGAAAALAPAVTVAAPAAAAAPARTATPALALIGAALRLPHGTEAAELRDALLGNKAMPQLDPDLRDDEGFPVMSARAALADSAAEGGPLRERIGTWLDLHGFPDAGFTAEQWRALALGAAVAAELGERAAAHTGLPGTEQAPAPLLRLIPLWPDDWRAAQRAAAGAWLRHTVALAGWPLERIVLAVDDTGQSPAPDVLLATLAATPPAAGAPLVAMLIAAASHIGEASIERWSARGELFSASAPQGRIPGEGAAGLLLVALGQASQFGPDPVLWLQGGAAVRDASADGARRADPTMLQAVVTQVLADAAALPAAVKLLVADTGHRSSRAVELMSLAGAALPQLDAGDEVLRVGHACGDCGAASLVGAWALAAHQANALQAPVLCIGNEHPLRRSAALIRPAPLA